MHDPVIFLDKCGINTLFCRHNSDQVRKLRLIAEVITRHDSIRSPLMRVQRIFLPSHFHSCAPRVADAVRLMTRDTGSITAEEMRSNPSLTRLEAATRVRDRLQAKEKPTPTRKDTPMETTSDIVKSQGGIVAVSKRIAVSGDSLGLTPDQVDEQLTKQAQTDKRPDETFEKSFERLFARPEVWQAQNIVRDAQYVARIAKSYPDLTKSYPDYMSIEPVQVSGDDVTDETDKAHQQLMALAEKQRSFAPWLSIEQAYERVFTAKENAEFSRRAVTSFPRRV